MDSTTVVPTSVLLSETYLTACVNRVLGASLIQSEERRRAWKDDAATPVRYMTKFTILSARASTVYPSTPATRASAASFGTAGARGPDWVIHLQCVPERDGQTLLSFRMVRRIAELIASESACALLNVEVVRNDTRSLHTIVRITLSESSPPAAAADATTALVPVVREIPASASSSSSKEEIGSGSGGKSVFRVVGGRIVSFVPGLVASVVSSFNASRRHAAEMKRRKKSAAKVVGKRFSLMMMDEGRTHRIGVADANAIVCAVEGIRAYVSSIAIAPGFGWREDEGGARWISLSGLIGAGDLPVAPLLDAQCVSDVCYDPVANTLECSVAETASCRKQLDDAFLLLHSSPHSTSVEI